MVLAGTRAGSSSPAVGNISVLRSSYTFSSTKNDKLTLVSQSAFRYFMKNPFCCNQSLVVCPTRSHKPHDHVMGHLFHQNILAGVSWVAFTAVGILLTISVRSMSFLIIIYNYKY